MSTHLKEHLRREAATAPTFDVYARSIATARRTRRRIAAVWVIVLAGLSVALPAVPKALPDTPADAPPRRELPDRVGDPPLGALRTTTYPHLGAASVVFMGATWRYGPWNDDADQFAVVGADTDRYRTQKVTFGEDRILLSPDGRTIATGTELVDLETGRTRPQPGDGGVPLAWSPDGRKLVLAGQSLSIADVTTGGSVKLGPADDSTSAAWSPDGRLLAYTTDQKLMLTDPQGRATAQDPLPSGSVLAGKGAWTPDGEAVGVVQRDTRSWPPTWLDIRSGGRPVPGPRLPAVPADAGKAELLGWRADGSAIVFVNNDFGAADVLVLTPGALMADRAMALPDTVFALDIADSAIASGLTRHGNPPFFMGPRTWLWVAGTALVAIAAFLLRRRARGRPRRQVIAYPWEMAP